MITFELTNEQKEDKMKKIFLSKNPYDYSIHWVLERMTEADVEYVETSQVLDLLDGLKEKCKQLAISFWSDLNSYSNTSAHRCDEFVDDLQEAIDKIKGE
jgi:hypothetical protein